MCGSLVNLRRQGTKLVPMLHRTLASASRSGHALPLTVKEVIDPPKGTAQESNPGPPAAPVLVLHGLLGSASNWRTTTRTLAEKTGRSFHLANLRNHGDSPHSDSMDLLDMAHDAIASASEIVNRSNGSRETGRGFAMLGHSLGGKVAMRTALSGSAPDLERIVVVDIAPVQHDLSKADAGHVLRSMKKLDLRSVASHKEASVALERDIPSELTRGFVLQNIEKNDSAAVERGDAILKWRVNLDVLASEAALAQMSDFPDPSSVSVFEGPALFVFGGRSDVAPRDHHDRVHRFFPNAEIVVIEKAAHMPHFEAREELVQAVSAFLGPQSQ